MTAVGWQLGVIAVLIGVNALFAGAELALISLNQRQLEQMRRAGGAAAIAARLADDPTRFLSTIQVGITFAGFLASAVAAVSLAEPLIPTLEDLIGGAAEPVAVILVTVALAFLASPIVWLLAAATTVLVRLAGVDPEAGRAVMSADEIRDVIASTSALGPEQRRMISGAFESSELAVRDVLVPRRAIVSLEADWTVEEGIAQLRASRHTRAPVIQDDIDHVVGTIHILDLIGAQGTIGEHSRETIVFPEFVRVIEALKQMQSQRLQMAMVADEHGGIDGMVTVEDLVEEIVGEIFDEFDPKIAAVRREVDGSLLVRGEFPLHDLNEVDVLLEVDGPYTTVGGLVMDRLGRVPEVGLSIREADWTLEVTSMRGLAVRTVRLTRADSTESPED
jgi:putative hemolysin